jgi:hypothetical protein
MWRQIARATSTNRIVKTSPPKKSDSDLVVDILKQKTFVDKKAKITGVKMDVKEPPVGVEGYQNIALRDGEPNENIVKWIKRNYLLYMP